MKYQGQTLKDDATQTIVLERPCGRSLELTIQPLPLGFHRMLCQRGIVAPTPPKRVARDSNGKPLRNADGTAVLISDDQDTDFRTKLELFHQRVAVLIVWQGLQVDQNIEFEAQPPTEEHANWIDFADALYQELENASFYSGDILYLCDEIARISNLTNTNIQQATQRFF